MESLYFLGWLISFIVGVIKVLVSLSYTFSIRANNVKKIGLFYSPFQGTFVTEKSSSLKYIWFATYVVLIAPIFSWLSVLSAAWGLIHWYLNKPSTPDAVKTIQFKIATMDLTKEQMIECQESISKILGVSGPVRTGNSDLDDDDTLILEAKEWYSEVSVDHKNKVLNFYAHTPDYDGQFYSKYEYKFDSEQIHVRLIEKYSKHYNETDWDVKNGVVLEDELRNSKYAKFSVTPIEEKIDKFKQEVKWHNYHYPLIKFFTMRMHPELFPNSELKRLIKNEAERIAGNVQYFSTKATVYGLIVDETEDGYEYKYPENFPEESKAKVEELFSSASMSQLQTSTGELSSAKMTINKLLKCGSLELCLQDSLG